MRSDTTDQAKESREDTAGWRAAWGACVLPRCASAALETAPRKKHVGLSQGRGGAQLASEGGEGGESPRQRHWSQVGGVAERIGGPESGH